MAPPPTYVLWLDDSDLHREVMGQEAVQQAVEATVQWTIADEVKSKAVPEQARLDHQRYSGLLASKGISQEQTDKTAQNFAVADSSA